MSKQQKAEAESIPEDAFVAGAADVLADAPPDNTPDNMTQLRQLLFGEQMRDYDQRFRDLGDRIAAELDRLAEEQRARVESLDQFVRAELERLAEAQRQAQQTLGDNIDALARELAGRLDSLQADIGDETSVREQALAAQSRELTEALEDRVRTLDERRERERERVDAQKTGRDELAALFSDLAQRLGSGGG
jgi:restriction endonuclease